MDSPEKYNNYLTLLQEHHELMPQVVSQIKKDFGSLLGESNPELTGNLYEALYSWIFPVMENLYKNDRRRFTSLMYSVDAAYMKNKFVERRENEMVQWTHAVILRECLKVFIRNNYPA